MGRIEWEKYKEVFASALEEENFLPEDDQDEEESWIKRQFSTDSRPRFSVAKGPYLMGPQGLIPLTEGNIPSKLYNLWVGHTDFVITEPDVDKILTVPGVEVLRVFSPYRFWLGVGRLFHSCQVKKNIEKLFQLPVTRESTPAAELPALNTGTSRAVELMKQFLVRTYPFWAIIQLPNGQFRTVVGQTSQEVEDKLGGCPVVDSSWGPMRE